MKILVCISNVPDTTAKITFASENTQVNTSGIQYILNPYDEIALAKAIEINGEGSGETTVIHVGEASADATIRKALAIGADSAVRVNAAPRDAYFVAFQIAEYAKSQGFQMILAGRESIDYNGAQVPAMVAEFLNLPSVSVAKKIDIDGNDVRIEREIEGGKEIIKVPLPLVAGCSEGVAEPKIPNMRGIMSARTKPLEVIDPVEIENLIQYTSYETPAQRGAVTMIPADNPAKLVELLHKEAKVI